jgi:hypothetical protein
VPSPSSLPQTPPISPALNCMSTAAWARSEVSRELAPIRGHRIRKEGGLVPTALNLLPLFFCDGS